MQGRSANSAPCSSPVCARVLTNSLLLTISNEDMIEDSFFLEKIGLVPLPGYAAGGIDQTYMAIGLRKIPPLGSVGNGVFAEDAQMVTVLQELIHNGHRVVRPSHAGQGVDIPECADQESAFGKTKIVIVFVAIEQAIFG